MKLTSNRTIRAAGIFFLLYQLLFVSGQGIALASPQAPAQNNSLPANFAPDYRYVRTFGEAGHPYPADAQNDYLNNPAGIIVKGGKLYFTEQQGQRLWGLDVSQSPAARLTWAPYGVAGVNGDPDRPDTVLNNPRGVALDPNDNGKLWVANSGGWLTAFDTTTGEPLFNIRNFNTYGLPHSDRFECPTAVDIDPSSTADLMRVFAAEQCGANAVLVFSIEHPYNDTDRTVSLVAVIQDKDMWNLDDIALVPGIAGALTIFVAHDNGLFAFAETGANTNDWNQPVKLNNGNYHGIGVNPKDADHIYFAGDWWNHGSPVQRCELDLDPSSCSEYIPNYNGVLNQQVLDSPQDIAFDEDGNAYVTDNNRMVVKKFTDPSGEPSIVFGTDNKPYDTPLTPDAQGKYYYNNPQGLLVDKDHNLYILENEGDRLTKLAPNGSYQWSFGVPGSNSSQDSTDKLAHAEGSPVMDSQGFIYVNDRWNNRLVILNGDGQYVGAYSPGNGELVRFDCVSNLAIGPNDDLFVSDECSQTVKVYGVYGYNRFYRSTIGIRNEQGTDNQHFYNPRAIAVMDVNTILVGDTENARVQKCVRTVDKGKDTWACSTFLGVTGDHGDDLNHFDRISSLAWDAANQRLFVADESRSSVRVFDAMGKLLAVIGDHNWWGTDNSRLGQPGGVAVDPNGIVYVSDRSNFRVQKYITAIAPVAKIGQLGGAVNQVLGDGSYLYTLNGDYLAVYSIANPQNPALVGKSDMLPASPSDKLAINGSTAFVTTSDNFLRVLSLADKTHPAQMGSLPLINPQGLAAVDNLVFTVSCCGWGQNWNGPRLEVVNAADPAKPQVVAYAELGKQLNGYDNYVDKILVNKVSAGVYRVYLTARMAGVVAVEYTTAPSNFTVLGQYTDKHSFHELALSADGSTVFALDRISDDGEAGELHALSASDLSPQATNTSADVRYSARMTVSGSNLFLSYWKDVFVYDIGNIVDPLVHFTQESYTDGFGRLYPGTNGILYSASQGLGLLTLHYDPQDAQKKYYNVLDRDDVPVGYAAITAAKGTTFYNAGWEAGLRVIDASDPANMTETARISATGYTQTPAALFDLGGKTYLFATSMLDGGNNKLVVLDTAVPGTILADSTTILGQEKGFGGSTMLIARPGATNHALVFIGGANNGLVVFDVNFTDPAHVTMAFKSSNDWGFGAWREPAFYDDQTNHKSYLILPNSTDKNQVTQVIDITDPANPQHVGALPRNANDVEVLGNRAYLNSYDSGALDIYDLTKIANPKTSDLLGSYWYQDTPGPFTIRQVGGRILAYISNGNIGLRVLDVTDPSHISQVALYRHSWGDSVYNFMVGNIVYETYWNAGLFAEWAAPFTEKKLSTTADVLDSGEIDGVTYHLNGSNPTPVTLLHAPVFMGQTPPLPQGVIGIGHAFAAFARQPDSDQPVTTLGTGQTYTVSVKFKPEELGKVTPSSLSFYYWNGSQWVKENSTVNTSAATVTAAPNHFSLWIVAGTSEMKTYLPLILR